MKPKKENIDTRGTANTAVLKGGPKLTKLIEASEYDNKSFHFIIMVSEEFKWIVKEYDCLNVDTGKVKDWYSYSWTTPTNTIIEWEVLEHLIILGTNIWYIFG